MFVDLGGGRSCVYADVGAARPRRAARRRRRLGRGARAQPRRRRDRSSPTSRRGLPFADGEVDLLVSRVVLEHVDGVPGGDRATWRRVITPGGRTIHFVPGRWSTFALAARLLPFGPLLKLLHFAIPRSVGVVEFDVHYDHTDPVALERVFREAGFRDVRVSWTAAQADYFRPVLPAYLLVALYQTLVRALGLRRLAAYVDRRRAPLSGRARPRRAARPVARMLRRSSTSRSRCSRIAWRWASTFDWSLSRDMAAEKCSSSRRMNADGDEEQRVRRRDDAHLARDHVQRVLPDGEAEDHDRAEQPQQRVALHQRAPAHQLEHEQQQPDGADDRDDLQPGVHQIPCSAATAAASPGSGTARRRPRPTNSASSTLTM